MTDEEIAAIEVRAAAATPGPWVVCGAHDGECPCGLVWSEPCDCPVASAQGDSLEFNLRSVQPANQRFIADARTDVPRLVAALRLARTDAFAGKVRAEAAEAEALRLREENEDLTAAAAHLRERRASAHHHASEGKSLYAALRGILRARGPNILDAEPVPLCACGAPSVYEGGDCGPCRALIDAMRHYEQQTGVLVR